MKIFDKAAWHIDAGESPDEVLEKFQLIFKYLEKKGMLSEDGKEILEIGIDSSVSLNESMVTPAGKTYLEAKYDSLLELTLPQLRSKTGQ